MAQKSMTLLKVSNLNCNSGQRKSVEKGIISNGIVLDNALLNEKLKVTENINSKDPSKRPSLPIYRPGMGLLHRHSPKANVSDEERAPDGEENTEKCNWSTSVNSLDINLSDNSDVSLSVIKEMNIPQVSKPTARRKSVDKGGSSNSKKLSKNKRPDQPKYIPKPKIAAQCPSPDPSEGEDTRNCSLSRSRSPLEAYSDSEKKKYVDNPLNMAEKNKRHHQRQTQNKRNDLHDRAAQKNKSTLSTNNVGVCTKFNTKEKRSQDVFNGNALNLGSENTSHLKYSDSSNANCNTNSTTVLDKNSLGSNSVPRSTTKSDLKDNYNSSKTRKSRRSRENKSSGLQVSAISENNPKEKVLTNDKIENEKPKFANGCYSESKQTPELKRVETAHDNQSKMRTFSIVNPQSLNVRRDESPTQVTSTLPFSSPKGRGRGRSQNSNLNSSDNRQLTPEIVPKKVPSTIPLTSIDYDGEGPRPTLIFESSHKITDWNQEVTNEENLRNAAIANASSEDKHHNKKLDCGIAPNRFHRQLSESSTTSDCAGTSSVPLRTDRIPSEFQQNPPPRFQRNKESLNKQFIQSEDTNFPHKAEKGILKVNWENSGVGRDAPTPSNPLPNMHYSRNSEPLHYKTLFDPSQPLNNRSMHTNTVQSYHQPIVPRNLMTGNVYPKTASPGMHHNRRLDYNDREQYVLQQVQPSHTAIKPQSTTYPYMIHQPPLYGPILLNGQIPPNPQLPPPQSGMFPQPYSETLHPPENSNKRVKPIVEKNLCDIGLLERELNTYLSKGLDNVDQKGLGRCRWKIQLRYENIILADPRFCADKNVESALWKSAFHQVIEAYRKLKDLHPNRQEEFNKAINNLVEEGTVFYESLLEKQQETFGINFSQYLDTDAVSRPLPLDSVKIILISTQKLFICLGDLARYREQATNTSNYGKARSWYMKAQQIAPKNGRPYNQLAILAICARRKLDAVYYYMRSLAASNPFLSARESLLGLFDEARKKYVVLEKKKLDEKSADEKSSKLKNKGWRNKNNDRIEVWCHPPGMIHSKSEEPSTNENSDNEISTVELNKRFVLSFLHVHGKLFTKVGMENFTEIANQMLQEFRNLLQCTPAPLASVRLLQLLAINMFSVANASSKGGPPMDSSERPLLQEQALQVSLAMMAIVIERSIFLLKEHLASPNYPAQLTSYDLAQLLPTVKIFTDWMSCQRNLWSPPPTLGDLRTGCKGDIWTLYANLLNELGRMKDCGIELKNTKLEGYEPVTLPEDVSLACFVPLLGAPQNPYYGQPPMDKERARTWLRVIRLLFFGDYLCGISPPYLKFDVQTTSYVSLITSHSEDNTESSGPNTTYNSSDEDNEIEDLPDDVDEDISKAPLDDTSDISELWHRQEALKRNKERDERRKAQIQQVLRDHRTKRPMEIQVTPKYLIPDTNCFIDHLDQLDLLLKSNTCNLVVPLIVINELDGLALGERPNSSCGFRQNTSSPSGGHNSYEHQQMRVRQVSAAAKEAVAYLEESFASREFKLKAITSKGNLLDSISIRSEEIGEKKGTNDDLILSCCLHYCSNDKASDYMPKTPDEPIHITREVVLITDDRNLRVKAMTHNVPTRSLDEFLRWARIR